MKAASKILSIITIMVLFVNCSISQTNKLQLRNVLSPKITVSGGLGMFTADEMFNSSSAYVLNLDGTYYTTESVGLRLSSSANFFGNNQDTHHPGVYREGGGLSVYVVTFDLLIGDFNAKNKIYGYFTSGLGFFIPSWREETIHYGEYTFTSQGHSDALFGIKLGGGFSAKLSKNVSAESEFLYGFPILYPGYGIVDIKPGMNFKVSKNLSLFVGSEYAFPVILGENGGFLISDGYLTFKSGITWKAF